jgi:hypothetical protein
MVMSAKNHQIRFRSKRGWLVAWMHRHTDERSIQVTSEIGLLSEMLTFAGAHSVDLGVVRISGDVWASGRGDSFSAVSPHFV